MKFKLKLLLFNLIGLCISLKLKSLETMRLASKSKEGNFDIIKILNINDTDIDNQETRILRRKMKRSDLENFEGYLDSYLNILKSFNKKISQNKIKNFTNLSFEIMHKNLDRAFNNSTEKNLFSDKKNKSIIDNHVNKSSKKILNKEINFTNKNKINCNNFQQKNNIILRVNLDTKIIQMNKKTNNSIIIIKNISQLERNQTKQKDNLKSNYISSKIIPDLKINKTLIESNRTNIYQTEEFKNSLNISPVIEDKIYEKIEKKDEFNEDFIEKQKEIINRGNNYFLEHDNDFNIYKKIINISLSLIVVGLLMGILLGLILVMYLNSKNSK